MTTKKQHPNCYACRVRDYGAPCTCAAHWRRERETGLKHCAWCRSGFQAAGDLCGKCKEQQAANRAYNASR